MNIGFCKVGKSIKFLESTFQPTGGDIDPVNMLRLLANHNPDDTFYLIGRSDFSKQTEHTLSKLFDYNNVIDLFDERLTIEECTTFVDRRLTELGVKLDTVVMLVGQIATVNIPNRIKKVKIPDECAMVLNMALLYSTPVLAFVNEQPEVKIIEIVNDPRYTCGQSVRDFIATPKVSLGQYDFEYTKNSIISYENQNRKQETIRSTYSQMETLFLYDKTLPAITLDNKVIDRPVPFMIVLNEGKPSRYKLLNEWVLNQFNDVSIYGRWSDVIGTDCRFRGSKKIFELQEILLNVRSTFIIPIKKGWVTSKYIEMIHAGVVPFLHPTYDEQNHLEFPDFFKPKTPEELVQRVEMLSDDTLYLEKINWLRNKYCVPGYYDGSIVNNIVMSEIYDNYKAPVLKKPVPCDEDW